ncbi:3-hydroxyacyl-CoA dehydrogenase [Sphingobium sp. OAS761]|uniref:3-hydroxyacyl-CoA dehydrogenase NAD-binding domain-containing protein n=1 Tax=Sphingobium sp. OAS761 TaxID=2817901 RepID=UPI00209ED6AB|nr:3-hydroxyacyl-CoA dehydrogenase NAD-binding domain-containing protein [Sphingobium sp. OAS761]MCP1472330.1 3-hydroxyacyl-CoA dehydrogenase [Sphingobium sp. OAS761]
MTALAQIIIDGGIATIVIDSPPVNALGLAVRKAIVANVQELGARTDVDAIVLRCAGRTFFAGADITEFGKPFEAPDLNDVVAALEDSPKIVVAAIHGTVLGGGLEVALGAHYRIAMDSAKAGFPEIALGLLPGAGGTQRGPRVMDAGVAFALITSGKPVGAKEALSNGLFDRLTSGDLAADAVAYARELAAEGAPLRRLKDEAPKVSDRDALTAAIARAKASRSLATQGCAQAVEIALTAPFEEGLIKEREIFDRLMGGAESRALRHIFFAEREAGKLVGVAKDTPVGSITAAGVIGAGTMGGGIAMNFLNVGIPVTLVEVKQEALDRGVATIRKNYETTAKKGRMTQEQLEQRMALLNPTLEFDALGSTDLVIEAVFESMAVKQDIFGRLDRIMKPGALMASNTSFLDIDTIAAATQRPQHVLGLHFFSPANVMKLLEVVRGAKTSDSALATAMALAKKLGKTAVVSRVCHGFIANRIMDVRRVEAEKLVLQGSSVMEIDRALIDYGFPMGQFQMFDLVGLDVMGRDSDERTLMSDFVAAGRLGQKSGGGYYDYDDQRKPSPSAAAQDIIASHAAYAGVEKQAVRPGDVIKRLLYPVVNEGARLIEEGVVQRASDIDVAVVAGYGWPAETGGPIQWGEEQGLSEIVAYLDGLSIPVSAELRSAAEDGRALGANLA